MYLTGVVLLSVALKFQTLMFHEGNDLPYVLYVSGYAATAAWHGRVKTDDVETFIADAERWAYDRYAPALMRGSSLPEAEQQAVAEELAGWIGLSTEFVRRCNLRVDLGRFCRELLRDRRATVGRLDSRFVGRASDAAGERLEVDPSMSALYGAYASAFHRDLRTRLAYEEDELYEILNLKANQAWRWDQDNRYLDVTSDLRQVLLDNEHLRVLVASGIYDLATPVTATDYTLNQLGLEPDRRDAVRHHKYPAGHMMYVHEPSMAALRRDLLAFYAAPEMT
jgi:carboxypeptidase C (cathepsin A)